MKIKGLFAALLAIVIALSFAACGGKDKADSAPEKTYTQVNEYDEGNGPFDGSSLCADFSVPEGFAYTVSNYDVNLELEEYNFSLSLKKDDSNIYFFDTEYAYNDTAEEEYEAFITSKVFDNDTVVRGDDVAFGDKTFKVVSITDEIKTTTYYIYTYDSAATNHKMNFIITPSLATTPMDDPDIVAFIESIIAK